jgi:hypothetical protein
MEVVNQLKILVGGASMLFERSTRNVSGLVKAKPRMAATRTLATIAIMPSIHPPSTVLNHS